MKRLKEKISKPLGKNSVEVKSFNGRRNSIENLYISIDEANNWYTVTEARKIAATLNAHIKRIEAARSGE